MPLRFDPYGSGFAQFGHQLDRRPSTCPQDLHSAGCACAFLDDPLPGGAFDSLYSGTQLVSAMEFISRVGAVTTPQLQAAGAAHRTNSLRPLQRAGLVASATAVSLESGPGRPPKLWTVNNLEAVQTWENIRSCYSESRPRVVREHPSDHEGVLLSQLRLHLESQFGPEAVRWGPRTWDPDLFTCGHLRLDHVDTEDGPELQGTVVLVTSSTARDIHETIIHWAARHVRSVVPGNVVFVLNCDRPVLRTAVRSLGARVTRGLHTLLTLNSPRSSADRDRGRPAWEHVTRLFLVHWNDWFPAGHQSKRYRGGEARPLSHPLQWQPALLRARLPRSQAHLGEADRDDIWDENPFEGMLVDPEQMGDGDA